MSIFKRFYQRLVYVIRTNMGLTIVIIAALLLELTSGIFYYSAQNIIERTADRLITREMNAIYLCIRNKLTMVEVTIDNMAWVVRGDLAYPDTMFITTRRLVEHNPSILGSSISFVPDYYPQKGHWFEAYAVRRDSTSIESMQLGSAKHDYTKSEFFTVPLAKGCGHWCEPYLDPDGAKAIITTYSVPVYDNSGKPVAIVDADISLDWLDAIMEEGKMYKSTQRFLVTGSLNLLAGKDNSILGVALDTLRNDPDRQGNIVYTDEKGEKRHIYYTPIGGKTDWILINVLKDKDVFDKLRKKRMSLLLPVMIGLFFVGFIVYRISRNMERLRLVNAEKDRIGGELRVANRIQQSMLPHGHLVHDDMDIFGSLVPAREVGGDLFDYFIRDEKLFFCIGDVSGKGAASAMVMGVIHTLFRAFSAHENNPARIMQAINEPSCQGNDSNMFVTLFIGVLDLPTGRLRYCNAGHDVPYVIHDSRPSPLDCEAHLPIGVFDDIKYAMQETQLQPDSTLFLYTDGLTEAMNLQHKQFGLERVENVLGTCAHISSQQINQKVTEAVHSFVGDAEQSDDLTMLVIRYIPNNFESTLSESLVLKNDIHEVAKLSTFMKDVANKMTLDTSLTNQLRLAVEEAVVNVMDYAYPIGTDGDITIRIMSNGQSLKIMIIDSGVPFDPTAKEKADTSLSAEDRQIGGLGILLVREMMDSINYEREEGKNILTLIKNLKA